MAAGRWDNVYHGFRIQWSYPTTWLVLFIALFSVTAVVWYLVRYRGWPKVPTAAAFAWWSFFVASTWRILPGEPAEWEGPGQFLRELFEGRSWARAVEVITDGVPFAVANVLLLVPLGFFLMLASRRIWVTSLAIVVTVLTVELLQSVVGGGNVEDVLANLLGGVIGVIGGIAFMHIWRAPDGGGRGSSPSST